MLKSKTKTIIKFIGKSVKMFSKCLLNLVRKFNPTKRNVAILVTSVLIIVISSYLLLHKFGGDFKKIYSLQEDKGNYYITLEDSSKIKLSRNGKLKLDNFYKEVSSKTYKEVTYDMFKKDLQCYSVEVRENLSSDLQYRLTESSKNLDSSMLNLELSGGVIKIASIGREPETDYFYINLKDGSITDVDSVDSLKVELSEKEIVIDLAKMDSGLLTSIIPALKQKVEDCYEITTLDLKD